MTPPSPPPPDPPSTEFEALVTTLREQPAESEWLEFKENMADPEEIGAYVSALSNSAALHGESRGYIVWGVQDGTHSLVGTSFNLRTAKKGNQALHLWLLSKLRPDPGLTLHFGKIAGKDVGVLEIAAASHAPVLFNGTAYIRIGSHKKKLNDHPVQAKQLYRNLDDVPFEHRLAVTGLEVDEVLEQLEYGVYFTLQQRAVPTAPELILEALVADQIVVLEPSGRYAITNLGALMFAERLTDFPALERKAPRVIKYKGKNKLTAEKEQLGGRGYACGFTGLVDYIDNLLPSNEIIGRALRTEVSMFPPSAVREIVANALIHQDFSISGSGPLIELYDNRIEFTNPGTPLVDPARFVDAPPRSRNEKLAYMMRRCHICEERGSGWDRIAAEIEMYQLPAPLVRVSENHTAVTLFQHLAPNEMSKEERIRAVYLHAVLKFVSGERITNSTVRERFGLSGKESSTASSYIREAVEAGWIAPHDPDAGRKHMQYVPAWAKGTTDSF